MKIFKLFSFLLLASLLFSCSKSEENEDSEHFLSGQQKALEKAQGVEDMLQQTEKKRRENAEETSN